MTDRADRVEALVATPEPIIDEASDAAAAPEAEAPRPSRSALAAQARASGVDDEVVLALVRAALLRAG